MRATKSGALLVVLLALSAAPAAVRAGAGPEHFGAGELRASLSWDSILAMETGIYKFGASAGVHVVGSLELGLEQQFLVPPATGAESRTWAYARLVPFRDWPLSPFISPRVGTYHRDQRWAAAVGIGAGAVMFVSDHLAFEVSMYTQWVLRSQAGPERQLDFDWRLVLFY